MEIVKSLSMKPYGIFHPSGPKDLLSRTTAWKKAKQYKSFFQTFGFELLSKYSSFLIGSLLYVNLRLALNPFGTSVVIFTPIYKTAGGKTGEG